MSFLRRFDSSPSSNSTGDRATPVHEERRRAIRSGLVASATLACPRCDAPVAVGDTGLALDQALSCPYCDHASVVRDFLSLRTPTRPNRVVVRVRLP